MIGPATAGVGTGVGLSGLSRFLDPLDLPRRSVWSGLESLYHTDPATGEHKSRAALLPALGGAGVGGAAALGLLGAGLAPWAIPIGLLAAGAGQALGEGFEGTPSGPVSQAFEGLKSEEERNAPQPRGTFSAPESLLGEDPHGASSFILKMLTDPMNLTGISAARGASAMRAAPGLAAEAAAPLERAALERIGKEASAPSALMQALGTPHEAGQSATELWSRGLMDPKRTMPDIGIPLPIQKQPTSRIPRNFSEVAMQLNRYPNAPGAGL